MKIFAAVVISADYQGDKYEEMCCGDPIRETNDRLSQELLRKKLTDAGRSGAEYLCTACVHCQTQFDIIQETLLARERWQTPIPAIVYPQLLGLSLGLAEEALGLSGNMLDVSGVKDFLN